ncbi:MAG: ABC-type sugar transport system ATPase component-like protein [Lacrimispora sp.]|jgi:ribose transport system ATP-binding protein|nr:ABC-type sugar transport system ATPase component-like protein [Lacrimispora sp.]
MKQEILRYENIYCSEGDQTLLKGLCLRAFQGQICCAIIPNLIEKQNFLRLLNGTLKPDSGWIYWNGEKLNSYRSHDQIRKQTAFIGKNRGIFSQLSVDENIFVANSKVFWWNRASSLCRKAPDLLKELDLSLPMSPKAHTLDSGRQKQIELLRAYVSGRKLAVITDLEMFLSEDEMKDFFELSAKLKRKGMTFLYVSGSDSELWRHADEVTIIKKGRSLSRLTPQHFIQSLNEPIITEAPDIGDLELNPIISLTRYIKGGELLNILDPNSAECSHAISMLEGCRSITPKAILSNRSDPIFRSVLNEIVFIEARSLDEMIFTDMTIMDNFIFMFMQKKAGIHLKKSYRKLVRNLTEGIFTEKELAEKAEKVSDECKLKLIYYRWIYLRPKVMVCIKPFSSIDFQLRSLTINLLDEALKSGIAVILITNHLTEAHTMKGKHLTVENGCLFTD